MSQLLYRKVQRIHCWKKQNSFNGFSPKSATSSKRCSQLTVNLCCAQKTTSILSKANAFQWLTKVTNRQFSYYKGVSRDQEKKPPRFLLFSNNISRTISPPLPHPRRLRRGKTKAIVEIFRGLAKNAIFLGKENQKRSRALFWDLVLAQPHIFCRRHLISPQAVTTTEVTVGVLDNYYYDGSSKTKETFFSSSQMCIRQYYLAEQQLIFFPCKKLLLFSSLLALHTMHNPFYDMAGLNGNLVIIMSNDTGQK